MPRRVHPTVRLGYVIRLFYNPLFLLLYGVHLWPRNPPVWVWVGLLSYVLVWPHVARHVATNSGDSKKAELRNLLVDAALIGFYVPIAGFSLWPNVAAFIGFLSGNLSVGGLRAARRCLLAYVIGIVVAGLLIGVHPVLLGASLFTQVFGILVVIGLTSVFGWLTYERQRSAVENGRVIRQQSAELTEKGRLLALRTRELEMALESAQAANAAKGNFLANMSHELRTPLNSIIGFANIMLRNGGVQLRQQDGLYVARIAANGAHLLTLINGILDLAKIDARQTQIDLELVDIAELLRATLAEMEPQAEERDVEVVTVLPDVAMLLTDRKRLKQIVLNLVSNAVKFTPGGTVTVRIVADGDTGLPARIEVSDTGIGIAPGRLAAVFGAFQQEDESTSRQYGGTGLGLTITRSLAQLLGWAIEARSELGVGSTFSVVMIREPSAARALAVA